MERIFSPWRMEYISQGSSGGEKARCIFCLCDQDREDPEKLVLGVYPQTVALCNRFPYNNGHVLAAPRRHVAALTDLLPGELAELFALVAQATRALDEEYGTEGFNIGMNLGKVAGAGVEAHLHVHIVPRWGGDTNFMTAVHTTRVLPESLPQTHARLAARFGRIRL